MDHADSMAFISVEIPLTECCVFIETMCVCLCVKAIHQYFGFFLRICVIYFIFLKFQKNQCAFWSLLVLYLGVFDAAGVYV